MLGRLPTIKMGPTATAAFAEWRKALLRAANPKGDGLIRCQHTPHGPLWKVDRENDRMVRLSGSGPAYGGGDVYPATGGTWVSVPGVSGLTNIYEDNGVTALAGMVVRVRPGFGPAASEWRFRYNRSHSTVPSCVYAYSPTGCNGAPLFNSTITFTPSGGGAVSCSTDCSGTCTVTLSSALSYTWMATHPRFTDTYSGSIGTGCPSPFTIMPAFSTVDATTSVCNAGADSCGEPTFLSLFCRGPVAGGTGTITYAAGVWTGTLSNGDKVISFDGGATMQFKRFLQPTDTGTVSASTCCGLPTGSGRHQAWKYHFTGGGGYDVFVCETPALC